MIKSEKGTILIDGTTTQVLVEFSMIVTCLYKEAKIDKQFLEEVFKDAFSPEQEVNINNKNIKDELINCLNKLLKTVKGDLDNE